MSDNMEGFSVCYVRSVGCRRSLDVIMFVTMLVLLVLYNIENDECNAISGGAAGMQ